MLSFPVAVSVGAHKRDSGELFILLIACCVV